MTLDELRTERLEMIDAKIDKIERMIASIRQYQGVAAILQLTADLTHLRAQKRKIQQDDYEQQNPQ